MRPGNVQERADVFADPLTLQHQVRGNLLGAEFGRPWLCGTGFSPSCVKATPVLWQLLTPLNLEI